MILGIRVSLREGSTPELGQLPTTKLAPSSSTQLHFEKSRAVSGGQLSHHPGCGRVEKKSLEGWICCLGESLGGQLPPQTRPHPTPL